MTAPQAIELGRYRRALAASVYRESFADYVERFWSVVTGAPLVRNRAIDAVVAVLQRVANGELWRVLIALPSGVGKSTLLCLYSGWRLARDPSHRVLCMSHGSDLAGSQSRRVRRLVESDEHRAMFPEIALRLDESTVAVWATSRNGRYISAGKDTNILGRRCLEAVLDDPLDAGERFSRAARESLWTWFSESLMTRLDGDRAPVIVVHQRLCLDDLIGRLIEQGGWHLLELPAEDDDGNLLAPTVLGREKLDELKARNPRAYATMFLQRPGADDGAIIARRAWRFHAPAGSNPAAPRPSGCATPDESPTLETPTKFDRICVSADMTFGGTKQANDFCAIHVWGSVGPHRFLLARWKRKASQREQRVAIKEMAARYRGAKVLIEKAAGGAGAIEELIAEGLTQIVPVIPVGSKAERLENVSPTIDNGLAFLPIGMVGLADLVEEMAGATRHDDDQDAAQMGIHWLNIHGRAPSAWTPAAVDRMHRMAENLAAGRVWVDDPTPDPSKDAREAAARDRYRGIAERIIAAGSEPTKLVRLAEKMLRGDLVKFGALAHWARQHPEQPNEQPQLAQTRPKPGSGQPQQPDAAERSPVIQGTVKNAAEPADHSTEQVNPCP